ncbi:hypothetical protein RchiOBHm_Chr4g0418291 [Rosa chinensis]|uniref:Uncharacterized protein n=1 Tax=Rosa chinensis TaxID=74649 RepID=A0A2P6QXA6_ROSCH|nr:hypothetical protein RchiOBHm_Chr4g0418291 [Rosa chinensis]
MIRNEARREKFSLHLAFIQINVTMNDSVWIFVGILNTEQRRLLVCVFVTVVSFIHCLDPLGYIRPLYYLNKNRNYKYFHHLSLLVRENKT